MKDHKLELLKKAYMDIPIPKELDLCQPQFKTEQNLRFKNEQFSFGACEALYMEKACVSLFLA